jgi:hypothetical protein
VLHFSRGQSSALILTKKWIGLNFWAILSQTDLVTLPINRQQKPLDAKS